MDGYKMDLDRLIQSLVAARSEFGNMPVFIAIPCPPDVQPTCAEIDGVECLPDISGDGEYRERGVYLWQDDPGGDLTVGDVHTADMIGIPRGDQKVDPIDEECARG